MTRDQIRQQIRDKRRTLTLNEQQQAARRLTEKLINLEQVKHAKNIAIYLSNDGELNTNSFINWCWQHNINTYLPVIHPFSKGHLLFLHYHQQSKMVNNKYGIKEPELSLANIIPFNQLDIIFTPLVAFDESGERLGMGGGYYDRTLAQWYKNYQGNKQAKPFPIGLAHDFQKVPAIPSQNWDIPLPQIITPSANFSF